MNSCLFERFVNHAAVEFLVASFGIARKERLHGGSMTGSQAELDHGREEVGVSFPLALGHVEISSPPGPIGFATI
jgi:hypothetical protein